MCFSLWSTSPRSFAQGGIIFAPWRAATNWLRKARMSEIKKQAEPAGIPGAPPDHAPAVSEPTVPAVPAAVAKTESATSATLTQASAGPPIVTPPDAQALEEWNQQVRRRMRRQTR